MSGRWVRHYHRYITESASKNIPLKIVYYENLQTDSVKEMKEILEFLEDAIGFKADNKKKRLSCISNVRKNWISENFIFLNEIIEIFEFLFSIFFLNLNFRRK